MFVIFTVWAIKPNQYDPRDRAAQDFMDLSGNDPFVLKLGFHILDGPARKESNPLNYLYKENEKIQ